MAALQSLSYLEFCSVLNLYLEKVERNNKEIKKAQKTAQNSAGKSQKRRKS